jgi:hypothetical protein
MAHLTSKSWTEADIAKLIELAEPDDSVHVARASYLRLMMNKRVDDCVVSTWPQVFCQEV